MMKTKWNRPKTCHSSSRRINFLWNLKTKTLEKCGKLKIEEFCNRSGAEISRSGSRTCTDPVSTMAEEEECEFDGVRVKFPYTPYEVQVSSNQKWQIRNRCVLWYSMLNSFYYYHPSLQLLSADLHVKGCWVFEGEAIRVSWISHRHGKDLGSSLCLTSMAPG